MDWVLWTLKLFPSSGEERAILVERKAILKFSRPKRMMIFYIAA
jgi:hypothetical protein